MLYPFLILDYISNRFMILSTLSLGVMRGQQLVQALLIFNGFGPLSLADSESGAFLVRSGVLGSRGGAWGEVCLKGDREILTFLILGLTKNCVYLTKINNSLIWMGAVVWPRVPHFLRIKGFFPVWEESCDRVGSSGAGAPWWVLVSV